MKGRLRRAKGVDKTRCEPCSEAVKTEGDQAVDGREGLEKELKNLIRKSTDPCSTVKVSLDE